jgi:hypothetical protein
MMRIVGGSIAALLVGALGYGAWQTSISADVGAAAMAKTICSCVFVQGRTREACRADDPPGFEAVSVTIDAAARTATGTAGGLVSRRATYSEQYGCTLEP